MPSLYPTAGEIHTLFSHLSSGEPDKFWSRISPNVDWVVPGSNPISGHYHSLADWKASTIDKLNSIFTEPLKLVVTNVAGGGEQEWAVVELSGDTMCNNGMPFNNRYAWVCRFDEKGMIVQIRAYLDTQLVSKALEQNF